MEIQQNFIESTMQVDDLKTDQVKAEDAKSANEDSVMRSNTTMLDQDETAPTQNVCSNVTMTTENATTEFAGAKIKQAQLRSPVPSLFSESNTMMANAVEARPNCAMSSSAATDKALTVHGQQTQLTSFFTAELVPSQETNQPSVIASALEQTVTRDIQIEDGSNAKLNLSTTNPNAPISRRKEFIQATILQASRINMMLPPGIKLVTEADVKKMKKAKAEQPPRIIQERPEIIIEGVRATSRQIALKEREAQKKIRKQKRGEAGQFLTPAKPKKRSYDENPQAAADKAPQRKTEKLIENSPQIIRDQLMQSFSNKNGDEPNKVNWAVFTRCQQLISRVSERAEQLKLDDIEEALQQLEKQFRVRDKKYESGQEVTKALRDIVCKAIADRNVTTGPCVELYSYFTDQCEQAQVDEEDLFTNQKPKDAQKCQKTSDTRSIVKENSPFSSSSSDENMTLNSLTSSESDDQRQHNLKQAQAIQRQQLRALESSQAVPPTCTIIRLPKQAPDEFLTSEEKLYIAENVGRLDMKASEGIREIVKNNVSADDDGNMDFELEQLPFQVGKTLYRYIKAQMRRMAMNDRARRKTIERRTNDSYDRIKNKKHAKQVKEQDSSQDERQADTSKESKFSGLDIKQLSEYMEQNPLCHEDLTEQQKTDVAVFRMEQQQEFIEKNDGDIQKGKEEYSAYLMAIPGSVTFQKFRETEEEEDDDLGAKETNSVRQSVQVLPESEQYHQQAEVPQINQAFYQLQTSLKTQAASVEDSDSDSSSSSDSDSDEDASNSVLGKRTHQKAFNPNLTPSKQDISTLWGQMNAH